MFKPVLPILFRMLPLGGALFLMAADGDACIIIDNNPGEDECVNLDEVCPNLACDTGNVVVDGCAICECQETCEPGPAPECVNARLLDDCSWTCEPDGCFDDSDCGDGFFCAFFRDGAPGDAEADAIAPANGTCLPLNPPVGCSFDDECGPGFFCDLSGAGGGTDPGAPSPDGDAARPAPAPEGVCRALATECFDDADCREGQHCEPLDMVNGLVAFLGVCVDDTIVSECESDRDCGDGAVCVIECGPMPGCPECDACMIVGTCVEIEQPCFGDDECGDGRFCDFDTSNLDRPCLDLDGDNVCDDGFAPPAGVCRDLDTTCTTDDDCAAGQACVGTDICACDAQCIDDGNNGCLPCDCLWAPGICVDVVPNDECFADTDCARGERCELRAEGCDQPACEVGPDGQEVCHGCDPILVGTCVAIIDPPAGCFADSDCADDEFCAVPDSAPPAPDCFAPDCANRPIAPPQGTCEPLNTNPCALVRCAGGTTCEVDAAGNAVCTPDVGSCASDIDCERGTHCNAGIDVCEQDPSCQAGDNCIDLCFGYCVAN